MSSFKRENNSIVVSASSLILDIEGTTSSISFVKDVLFPQVRKDLEAYVNKNWDSDDFKKIVNALKIQAKEDEENKVEGVIAIPETENKDDLMKAVIANVTWQMDNDKKTKSLKDLQGFIMEESYKNGNIKGHVYEDVEPSLKSWTEEGKSIYIYSSGSVHAQKLLFGHSEKGDLLPLIKGHFDTTVGMKGDTASYKKILEEISCSPSEAAFLTDIPKEARAAKEAGILAILLSREGNSPLTEEDVAAFPVISSFADIVFDNNTKKRKLCTNSNVINENKLVETCTVSVKEENNVPNITNSSDVEMMEVEENPEETKTMDNEKFVSKSEEKMVNEDAKNISTGVEVNGICSDKMELVCEKKIESNLKESEVDSVTEKIESAEEIPQKTTENEKDTEDTKLVIQDCQLKGVNNVVLEEKESEKCTIQGENFDSKNDEEIMKPKEERAQENVETCEEKETVKKEIIDSSQNEVEKLKEGTVNNTITEPSKPSNVEDTQLKIDLKNVNIKNEDINLELKECKDSTENQGGKEGKIADSDVNLNSCMKFELVHKLEHKEIVEDGKSDTECRKLSAAEMESQVISSEPKQELRAEESIKTEHITVQFEPEPNQDVATNENKAEKHKDSQTHKDFIKAKDDSLPSERKDNSELVGNQAQTKEGEDTNDNSSTEKSSERNNHKKETETCVEVKSEIKQTGTLTEQNISNAKVSTESEQFIETESESKQPVSEQRQDILHEDGSTNNVDTLSNKHKETDPNIKLEISGKKEEPSVKDIPIIQDTGSEEHNTKIIEDCKKILETTSPSKQLVLEQRKDNVHEDCIAEAVSRNDTITEETKSQVTFKSEEIMEVDSQNNHQSMVHQNQKNNSLQVKIKDKESKHDNLNQECNSEVKADSDVVMENESENNPTKECKAVDSVDVMEIGLQNNQLVADQTEDRNQLDKFKAEDMGKQKNLKIDSTESESQNGNPIPDKPQSTNPLEECKAEVTVTEPDSGVSSSKVNSESDIVMELELQNEPLIADQTQSGNQIEESKDENKTFQHNTITEECNSTEPDTGMEIESQCNQSPTDKKQENISLQESSSKINPETEELMETESQNATTPDQKQESKSENKTSQRNTLTEECNSTEPGKGVKIESQCNQSPSDKKQENISLQESSSKINTETEELMETESQNTTTTPDQKQESKAENKTSQRNTLTEECNSTEPGKEVKIGSQCNQSLSDKKQENISLEESSCKINPATEELMETESQNATQTSDQKQNSSPKERKESEIQPEEMQNVPVKQNGNDNNTCDMEETETSATSQKVENISLEEFSSKINPETKELMETESQSATPIPDQKQNSPPIECKESVIEPEEMQNVPVKQNVNDDNNLCDMNETEKTETSEKLQKVENVETSQKLDINGIVQETQVDVSKRDINVPPIVESEENFKQTGQARPEKEQEFKISSEITQNGKLANGNSADQSLNGTSSPTHNKELRNGEDVNQTTSCEGKRCETSESTSIGAVVEA